MLQKSPGIVDKHVGARIRLRRTMLGFSQERLAENLGLTFQQVQKYEKGTNRVGASRLQHISEILSVPVSFFFDGAPQKDGTFVGGLSEGGQSGYSLDLLSTPDGVQLAKAFLSITDPKLRRRVVDLVATLAETSKTEA